MGEQAKMQIAMIPARLIRPMKQGQPRLFFDEPSLAKLRESIHHSQQQQPCRVFRLNKGEDPNGCEFELIHGERKWRSCLGLGIPVRCEIVPRPTEAEALLQACIENENRENLSAYERAKAFSRLQKMLGCTDAKLAQHLGLDATFVNGHLRLSRLNSKVLELMHPARRKKERLRMNVALMLERYPEEEQKKIAPLVVGVQARNAEGIIRRNVTSAPKPKSRPRRPSDLYRALVTHRMTVVSATSRFLEMDPRQFAADVVKIPPDRVRDLASGIEKAAVKLQRLRAKLLRARGIADDGGTLVELSGSVAS